MALQSDSISVHANDVGLADEVCRAAFQCGTPDALVHLVVFFATGLLTVFVLAAIIHLREARATVSEEQSRTAAEHDAFATFARRIAAIDPGSPAVQPASSSGPTATLTAEPHPPDEALEQVTAAYRETVMAVPHYDEDYDETLATNMAEEFGEEIATAVVSGSQFTQQLKQALMHGSRDAQNRRRELLSGLDREAEDLDEAMDAFGEIDAAIDAVDESPLTDRSFDGLAAIWERLGEIEDRCNRIIDRRQQRIHEWSMSGPRDAAAPTLHEYLYQPLSVTYPILADGTGLADRIRTAQHRVLIALTRRA